MQPGWRLGFARSFAAALWAFTAFLASGSSAAVADVLYSYDAAGRLIQVVDPSGESAQYVYDAAGNIVQIVRVPAGNVAIAGFTPKSGPIGTAVTIFGAGFSATPANNTVQFNGTAATVTTAAVNQLVAAVPAGATTGAISVTVGVQSATSAESFTVTGAPGGAPSISSFTPGGGTPGTAVTINGTNFDPVLVNNTVRFNAAQASVATVSATQISTSVPTFAGSGRISVRTLAGLAESADDFIVPPVGYTYADIISQARVAIDGASASLAIAATGKHGIVLFDGVPGDYLSLQLSTLSILPNGSIAFKVFDSTNAQIAAGNISASSATVHLPRLARSGTHSIIFSSGAATVSFDMALKRNAVLSASQPVMNADVPSAGQSIRGVYPATASQAATLRLAIASASPANQNVTFRLEKPDGTQLVQATGSQSADGAVLYSASLPISGNYFVIVQPAAPATATMTVALNPAMDVALDSASANVGSSPGWRSKRVLFAGTAGQHISIGVTALAYTPANGSPTSFTIYKPDGTVLTSMNNNCWTSNPSGNCPVLHASLSASGTYSLLVTPPAAVTSFSATITASTAITGTLAAATPTAVSITRSGQIAAFEFSGTAGQAVAIRLAVPATTPANQGVYLGVFRTTNGAWVKDVNGSPSTDGTTLHIGSLPSTETYRAYIIPNLSATGSLTATLNPADDVTIDGAQLSAANATAGYPKRYFFSGTAGQRVSVAMTGLAYNPGTAGNGSLAVYRPGGTTLANTSWCSTNNPGSNCQEVHAVLPVSGIYEILFTPPGGRTFTGTLTVSSVITGSLVAATPVAVNANRPGHHARLDFSGTAGQPATLRLEIAATTPANQTVSLSLYRSNGTLVGNHHTGSPSSGGVIAHVASLPVTDTYSVYVIPWWNSTASMTVTRDPASDLVIDGSSSAVATATPGYAKRYIINATAGQRLGIGITGNTHTPSSGASTELRLNSPSGTVNVNNCLTSGVARCEVTVNATVAGAYSVVITPPSGVNFSGTATVSTHATGSLTVGGGAIAVSQTRDGQDGWYTFSGTSGQLLRLNLTGMGTTPAGQSVWIAIVRPDGTGHANTMPSGATTSFDIPALNATGTHAVWVSPIFGAQVNMNLAIDPR
ncbi:MAG: beta strand repeat-containing protein [Burkholderiales bacterium]